MQKAAEMAIHDFRSGAWGRITLETPDEFAQWLAAGAAADAKRQAAKPVRKSARKRLGAAAATPVHSGKDSDAEGGPDGDADDGTPGDNSEAGNTDPSGNQPG